MSTQQKSFPHGHNRDGSALPRLLAAICLCLIAFPTLIGAITLFTVPMSLTHYEEGLRTPGSESYHTDMRRKLIETTVNGLVRAAAILVLAGFAWIAVWPLRWAQYTVFIAMIVVGAVHMLVPLVEGLAFAFLAWVHPFFLLPLGAMLLSAVAVRALGKQPLERTQLVS